MYTIEFQREGEEAGISLCLAVEKIIENHSSPRRLSFEEKRASFRDTQQGIVGLQITRYHTKYDYD